MVKINRFLGYKQMSYNYFYLLNVVATTIVKRTKLTVSFADYNDKEAPGGTLSSRIKGPI